MNIFSDLIREATPQKMPISNPAIISRQRSPENPNPVTFFDNEIVLITPHPHNITTTLSKMTDNNISDDQLSQFLAFTGSADPNAARQYLEMSGNQLEMAVSLFMDHNNNGGGSGVARAAGGGMGPSGGMGGMGPMGSPNVRAPDATRSMRLVGGPPSPGGGGGNNNNNNDAAAAAALMAAVGGPNAAQQMMMMGMMGG